MINLDWLGICNIGKFQSPINIIHGFNTIDDSKMINKIDSVISFDYYVPNNGEHKKFVFDGERLFLDVDLGNLAFFNKRGSKEIYRAYRIEIHFPSEHYVTMHNQTPRYALEIQIFHNFVMSTDPKITNQVIKVNKAVISLLYTIGSYDNGDEFLDQLGISSINKINKGYNSNYLNEPYLAFPKETLRQGIFRVGIYDTGFSIKALQGLLNAINSDPHIYYYYGSETTPPCREEILWIVFARPRSLSSYQFDFLKNQLAKSSVKGTLIKYINNFKNLFGNKRSIQNYDYNERGKIYSNMNGIRQVKRHSFFKNNQ